MSPVLAVPVAFLRAAGDSCPCWSVACARNFWQGTICRLASIPVSLNDTLCLEQGAALVVVSAVLATEAHHLEVSEQQCFCLLDLPHSLVRGVLCMQAICLAVAQISIVQLPVSLPTLNPVCDKQQCLQRCQISPVHFLF